MKMGFPGSFFLLVVIFGTSLPRLAPSAGVVSPFENQKIFVMEYYEICDHKVYPIEQIRFTFTRNGSYTIISGEEYVSRDIQEPISLSFRIERCKDKSNPETCKYYATWKWANLCAMIKVLPFVKDVPNAHTPPMNCPFKKNHYYMNGARLKIDSMIPFLSGIGPNIAGWKFRVLIVEKNTTIYCTDFALRIVNKRKRYL